MKLSATMMLTLDGVYQGPGAPDEAVGAVRRTIQTHRPAGRAIFGAVG